MNMPFHGQGEDGAGSMLAADPPADAQDLRAVRRVLDGDHAAFRILVSRYQQRAFALSMMVTRDRPAAEEVTQDAFLSAFRHLDRYDTQRPFYPWLSAIAVRLGQTWLRSQARRQSSLVRLPAESSLASEQPDPSTGAHPLDSLVADEKGRRLWSHVEALSSGERTVVLLHYRQQCSVDDIARQLGVASGTVKTLLFRARRKLRDRLAHEPGFAPQEKSP